MLCKLLELKPQMYGEKAKVEGLCGTKNTPPYTANAAYLYLQWCFHGKPIAIVVAAVLRICPCTYARNKFPAV